MPRAGILEARIRALAWSGITQGASLGCGWNLASGIIRVALDKRTLLALAAFTLLAGEWIFQLLTGS